MDKLLKDVDRKRSRYFTLRGNNYMTRSRRRSAGQALSAHHSTNTANTLDRLLSDPKSFDEVCKLIRDTFLFKVKRDALYEDHAFLGNSNAATILRESLKLNAQAESLFTRQQILMRPPDLARRAC